MKVKKACLIGIIALALLISFYPVNAVATVIGTSVPSTGDWVINNATVVSDEIIELNRSIVVSNNGSLTLDNTTIKLNCSSNGEFGITVKSGGIMTIRSGSYITRSGSGNYYFMVDSDATFSMTDSKLEYCGYIIKDNNYPDEDYETTGLYIQCDGTIEDCVIDNCYQGIICEGNTFTIKDTIIQNSYWHNIEGRGTKSLVVDGCSSIGLIEANSPTNERWSCKCNVEFFSGCTGTVKNSKISYGGSNNIWCKTDNTVTIDNNEIWGASKSGIWAADNTKLTITNNNIHNNTRAGISVDGSIGSRCTVTATGNTINDNGILTNPQWDDTVKEKGQGFAAFDAEVIFSGNNVSGNWGHNFETTNCTATFENNHFGPSLEKCNIEFFEGTVFTCKNNVIDGAGHNCFWVRDNVKGTIEGCTMKNSPHNGIWCGNNCELTIKDNVIDTCAENGIYSYNCTLTIENNEIKNCGDWGIYGEGCTITESDNTFTSVTKGERYLAFYIRLMIVDEDGAGLQDGAITLKDSSDVEIWSGTTDMDGLTDEIFVISTETYTAEGEWAEYSGQLDFTPEENGVIDLELGEDEEEDSNTLYIIIGIIVVIIIVILVIVLTRKGKGEEDTEEEGPDI